LRVDRVVEALYSKAFMVRWRDKIKPQKGSMTVTGKLEITIKINELPAIASTDKNGWITFYLDCDGRIFTATVKPKVFKKLQDAQADFPMWVAVIAGKLGAATEDGFSLDEPNIQVFEKKPKEAKPVEVA